ncbi:MAG: hypothetical protein U0637_14900 [Phycisphaerales bacterium]
MQLGAVVLCCTAGSCVASVPPGFDISRAGLYDAAHTAASGATANSLLRLSPNGVVLGAATRYNQLGTFGASVWRHEAGVTTRMGFFDAAHTGSSGLQTTYVASTRRPMNASGDIVGYSIRYSGASQVGNTAWLYQGGVLQIIGMTDAEHTGPDGHSSSTAIIIDDAGVIGGQSTRYVDGDGNGSSAWILENGAYRLLDLTDAAHTRADGYRASGILFMGAGGYVTGLSSRYSGPSPMGSDAWLWHNGVHTLIGLTDALHTSPSGDHAHSITGLSDTGVAAGFTVSYYPYPQTGASAWVADAAGTTRIGLLNPEHTNPVSGVQYAEATLINRAGDVAGRSFRYEPNGSNGESAWLYDPTTGDTTRIGLFDAEHTTDTGFQYSVARVLNAQGKVLGESTRQSSGRTVWVHRNGQTQAVGLYDNQHTSPNGTKLATAIAMNARGDAVGDATRWTGPAGFPSAWYFDDASGQTYPLEFSIGPQGECYTMVRTVLDDGTVLGTYTRFENGGSVNRQFWWSLADGLFDIEDRVENGIGAAGWQRWSYMAARDVPPSVDGSTVIGVGRMNGSTFDRLFVLRRHLVCDPVDFNGDSIFPDSADIADFLSVFSGSVCAGQEVGDPPCNTDIDFNNDAVTPDAQDIADLIRAFAGGSCP